MSKKEVFNLEKTKQEVKNKKKETDMNKIRTINWNTLLTVFTTLLIVGLLTGWTLFVWNMSAENQKAIHTEQDLKVLNMAAEIRTELKASQ